jgi:heterodisulfide reductase subunit A-like polyferredoxin
MAMRITIEHETPIMFKGHYLASADLDACVGCAECCPFSAIAIEPGHKRAVVDTAKCYGCGVCRSACEYDALTLVKREGSPEGLLEPRAASV